VFAIESKGGSYRGADYSQAVGGALALREAAGVRYVTPVVCVARSKEAWRQVRSVHIVRHDHLLEWLRRRPSTAISLDGVATALQSESD
jgi:hypothetical protein